MVLVRSMQRKASAGRRADISAIILDGGATSSASMGGLCKTGPMDEELKPEQVQGKATGYIQEITNLFYEV